VSEFLPGNVLPPMSRDRMVEDVRVDDFGDFRTVAFVVKRETARVLAETILARIKADVDEKPMFGFDVILRRPPCPRAETLTLKDCEGIHPCPNPWSHAG
jgi:hypothetical protein